MLSLADRFRGVGMFEMFPKLIDVKEAPILHVRDMSRCVSARGNATRTRLAGRWRVANALRGAFSGS